MAATFWIFGGLALILAVLAWIAAGSGARYAARAMAVGALAAGLGLGFLAVVELLGRPKPIVQAWMDDNEYAEVLAVRMEPDEAIYFWLLFPGETAPRAYSLPWSKRTAEQVEDAVQKGRQRDQRVEIEGPMSKWALYGDGEFPIRIIAPPSPREKRPPNKALEVAPGKQPI